MSKTCQNTSKLAKFRYLKKAKKIVYFLLTKEKRGGIKVECIYVPNEKMLTLKITQEIDEHTTEKIRRKIDNEITRFLPRKVILDFSDVNFMDSAGIGMLLGRYKFTRMLGGELEVININKKIKKLFEMSGILKIIKVTDNIKQKVI